MSEADSAVLDDGGESAEDAQGWLFIETALRLHGDYRAMLEVDRIVLAQGLSEAQRRDAVARVIEKMLAG